MARPDLPINIGRLAGPLIDRSPVEIVERKGLGHPDSICVALAEAFSIALCRFHRERFGLILHHNVDKVLLRGGSARPAFGGGEVIEAIEIFLAAGRSRASRCPLPSLRSRLPMPGSPSTSMRSMPNVTCGSGPLLDRARRI
jgi:S-adenosylmethionine synthetase